MKRKDQSDSLEEALLLSYMRISDENESIRALGDIQLNSPFISNHAMMKAAQQKLYFNIIKQPPPNIRSHNKEVPPDDTPEPDTVDDTSAPAAEVVHETPMNQACPVCNKNFNNKKDMTTHFLHKHTDSETTKEQLKTAKLEIEKVNNSKKELENKVLKTEKQLQSTRAELEETRFKCNICNSKNASEDHLKIHISNEHQFNGEGLRHLQTLEREKEETEKKIEKLQQQLKIEFQCHLCDNISQTKQDLNAHFASMHIKKYEDEISRLRTDKSTLDAKVKTLENQLAQKKSENAVIKETMEKERTQLRSNIVKSDNQIVKLRADRDTLDVKVKTLEKELAQKESHECLFKCDECEHQATSTGDLRRHLETTHNHGDLTNLDKLKEDLETTRRSESNLKKQLEIFETSKSELSAQLLKFLECTICSNGKVFKSKDDFDDHMKIHITDEKMKQAGWDAFDNFLESHGCTYDVELDQHIKDLKNIAGIREAMYYMLLDPSHPESYAPLIDEHLTEIFESPYNFSLYDIWGNPVNAENIKNEVQKIKNHIERKPYSHSKRKGRRK